MNFEVEKLEQQNQPIVLTTAIAIGALAVGSFGAGYVVGKDLAS